MNDSLDEFISPRLSLCMIVKDEKENLSRCLESAKPYVDEIIVVDTGSQDGTPEIALLYGAKVYYFKWCDDFSAARNFSLSLASGDWILVLDADEELVVNTDSLKEELTSQTEVIAYLLMLSEANAVEGTTPLKTPRLFRNLPELRYVSRLHEYIDLKNYCDRQNFLVQLESLRILHHPKTDPEKIQQELIERDIAILERIQQEEGLSLRLLYSLAGVYGATQQTEKAQECYAEAFERLFPHLMEGNPPDDFTFVPSLIFILAGQSLQNQDYETARLLCQRGLEWCANYPPITYIAGMTLIALGFPLGAIAYFEKCLQLGKEASYYAGEPFELSFMTTYPTCGLGAAYIQMKSWQAAISAFELALDFDENCTEAKQNIDGIKALLNQGMQ